MSTSSSTSDEVREEGRVFRVAGVSAPWEALVSAAAAVAAEVVELHKVVRQRREPSADLRSLIRSQNELLDLASSGVLSGRTVDDGESIEARASAGLLRLLVDVLVMLRQDVADLPRGASLGEDEAL